MSCHSPTLQSKIRIQLLYADFGLHFGNVDLFIQIFHLKAA